MSEDTMPEAITEDGEIEIPTSRAEAKSVYAKIAHIQGTIGAVKKTGQFKSSQTNYTYLSDGDVTRVVNAQLAANILAFIPAGITMLSDEPVGDRGGRRVVITSDWRVACGETGEIVECNGVLAESIDSYDKAISKCLTYARRDALRLVFNIAAASDQQQSTAQYPASMQGRQNAPQPAGAPRPAQSPAPPPRPAPAAAPAVAAQPAPVDPFGGPPGPAYPWGIQPVSFDDIMGWVQAGLIEHGWKGDETMESRREWAGFRANYIKSQITKNDTEGAKRFMLQIQQGDHDLAKVAAAQRAAKAGQNGQEAAGA